jgi:hypothetical protein
MEKVGRLEQAGAVKLFIITINVSIVSEWLIYIYLLFYLFPQIMTEGLGDMLSHIYAGWTLFIFQNPCNMCYSMLSVYVKYNVNIPNDMFWIGIVILLFSFNVLTGIFMQQYGASVFISKLSHCFIGILNVKYIQIVFVDGIANLVLFCHIIND